MTVKDELARFRSMKGGAATVEVRRRREMFPTIGRPVPAVGRAEVLPAGRRRARRGIREDVLLELEEFHGGPRLRVVMDAELSARDIMVSFVRGATTGRDGDLEIQGDLLLSRRTPVARRVGEAGFLLGSERMLDSRQRADLEKFRSEVVRGGGTLLATGQLLGGPARPADEFAMDYESRKFIAGEGVFSRLFGQREPRSDDEARRQVHDLRVAIERARENIQRARTRMAGEERKISDAEAEIRRAEERIGRLQRAFELERTDRTLMATAARV